jgi:DNA/RNA-binding domain of Phe-tRNA-synthetase-like protein
MLDLSASTCPKSICSSRRSRRRSGGCAPDFAALSIVVRAAANAPAADGAAPIDLSRSSPWADRHLDEWRAAFRAFGAKPQRTPARPRRCGGVWSGMARRRANAIVDVYNAISLRYAVPSAAKSLPPTSDHRGWSAPPGTSCSRRFATANAVDEPVEPGEVIWRDDVGVTCRR